VKIEKISKTCVLGTDFHCAGLTYTGIEAIVFIPKLLLHPVNLSLLPVLALDLDGTLADYSEGWQGPDIIGEPISEALGTLTHLAAFGWRMFLFTTRGVLDPVIKWLIKHRLDQIFEGVNILHHNPPQCSHKPIFDVLIDDRAYPFCGRQLTSEDWLQIREDLTEDEQWREKVRRAREFSQDRGVGS